MISTDFELVSFFRHDSNHASSGDTYFSEWHEYQILLVCVFNQSPTNEYHHVHLKSVNWNKSTTRRISRKPMTVHVFCSKSWKKFTVHNQRQTPPYNNITCECQNGCAKRTTLLSHREVRFQISAVSKQFFPGKRETVNEDDGRKDLFCTAEKMFAFTLYFFMVQATSKPTAYSHGRLFI